MGEKKIDRKIMAIDPSPSFLYNKYERLPYRIAMM